MQLNPIASSAISAAVWTQATRNLTGFGSGALTVLGVAQTTLAASAALDVRPAANKLRMLEVGVVAGAAGSVSLFSYDGTHTILLAGVPAGQNGGAFIVGSSVVGLQIKNSDGTNGAQYQYGGADFNQ